MRNFIKYFLSVLIIPIMFVVGCKEKDEVLTPATAKRQVTLKSDHDTLTAMMPTTTIYFTIPENSYVYMNVTNSRRQEVTIFLNNVFLNAGNYRIGYNASDIASGEYYYNLALGSSITRDNKISDINYVESKKMLVIK